MSKRVQCVAILYAVLLFGTAIIFYFAGARSKKEQPLQEFNESISLYLDAGWHVSHEPELPGPYRWGGLPFQSSVGSGGGAKYRNKMSQVGHRITPRPGVEQLIVPLEVADGRLTIAVLERH